MAKLSPEARAALMTRLFDPHDGIGFSLMRVTIGAACCLWVVGWGLWVSSCVLLFINCMSQRSPAAGTSDFTPPPFYSYDDNAHAPDPALSNFTVAGVQPWLFVCGSRVL